MNRREMLRLAAAAPAGVLVGAAPLPARAQNDAEKTYPI